MKSSSQTIRYYQITPDRWEDNSTDVIVETPVSLTINSEVWLTFMCTPVHLEAMAVGFLYNEGIINSREEIADVRLCPAGDNVDIWLHKTVEKPEQWRRTSGCTGGVTSVDNEPERASLAPNLNGGTLSADKVGNLIGQLFESQELYRSTGGVHTSALTDGRDAWVVAEDIGRHNTLDKIAGRLLLEELTFNRRFLLTTGRISSEMLQKAARLTASIVISRTSPSSLSIQLANQLGITLIGYARRNRFNVYTHPNRIISLYSVDEIEKRPIFP